MSNVFDQRIKIDTPSMNVFPLSYYNRLTATMGQLIPVLNKEIVPGDRFQLSLDTIMRLAPLHSPVFDRVYQDFHAFFVPNRILDPEWKTFITGGMGLADSTEIIIEPLRFYLKDLVGITGENHRGAGISSLADYLGIHFPCYTSDGSPAYYDAPTGKLMKTTPDLFKDLKLSSLPFLGYAKIYDDWYRNERIDPTEYDLWSKTGLSAEDTSRTVLSTSVANWGVMARNYKKDRFTTALPEPVIGGPVNFLAGNIPLRSQDDINDNDTFGGSSAGDPVMTDGYSPLYVDLANAASSTIQQLKTAFKMYSFFMKDTYNGNRYVEFIQSHYNVRVPDATLDRAIYLGSFRNPVQFGEIFQTSSGDAKTTGTLGDYAGRGAAAGSGYLFDETFLEHGQLYVIMSIVPEATYFQGIDKKFFKEDRFDYFMPEFQNIGDVPIFESEIYNAIASDSDVVFGYQSRWYEYKNYYNETHGDFLMNMDSWLFSRRFTSSPKISPLFSQIAPINNPFVIQDRYSDNYLIDIKFNIKALRPIMYYETF